MRWPTVPRPRSPVVPLDGEKLRGGYALTRIREGKEETWLLINAGTRTPTPGASRCRKPARVGAVRPHARRDRRDRTRRPARLGARSAARRAGARLATPTLATLTDKRFSDPDWIFERKFDGMRCLAFRRRRPGTAACREIASRSTGPYPRTGRRARGPARPRGSWWTARSWHSRAGAPASRGCRDGWASPTRRGAGDADRGLLLRVRPAAPGRRVDHRRCR